MAAASRHKFAPDATPRSWRSPVMQGSRAATPPVPDVPVGESRDMSERVIAYSRYVCTYARSRPPEVIDAEEEIVQLLREVTE